MLCACGCVWGDLSCVLSFIGGGGGGFSVVQTGPYISTATLRRHYEGTEPGSKADSEPLAGLVDILPSRAAGECSPAARTDRARSP